MNNKILSQSQDKDKNPKIILNETKLQKNYSNEHKNIKKPTDFHFHFHFHFLNELPMEQIQGNESNETIFQTVIKFNLFEIKLKITLILKIQKIQSSNIPMMKNHNQK